jgi:hypothetical protein
MGTNEEGTLGRLKALRREFVDAKIAEHNGRIVKTTGDGLLVEFASVVDAMRRAIEWQRDMAERHAGEQAGGRLEFRIGVNVGDVIIDGDDIFGDGGAEILTETSRRKARDLAGQALETGENEPAVLINVAYVLAHLGEDVGAMIGLVDRVLALNPSFARAWYIAGILRLWGWSARSCHRAHPERAAPEPARGCG